MSEAVVIAVMSYAPRKPLNGSRQTVLCQNPASAFVNAVKDLD